MRNWSIDTSKIDKKSSKYKKWYTEQLLTFGLDKDDYLEKKYLISNLDKLNIPEDMREYLEFLLSGNGEQENSYKRTT